MPSSPSIAIIGAGLAGLSCAYYLEKRGFTPTIYEKDKRVGGRIQTDFHQGFFLDRGFQVLLANYPEFKALFQKEELKLAAIPSGAKIYYDQKWFQLDNPLRQPSFLLQMGRLPFIKKGDQWKTVKLFLGSYFSSPSLLTTHELLTQAGLSSSFIEAFWRPFFGGVFLELDLKTRASLFIKLATYFATGEACLPQEGMQALPSTLAQRLHKTKILTGTTVEALEGQQIILEGGEQCAADIIVLATNGRQANQLIPSLPVPATQAVTCFYFALPRQIASFSSYLYLNGTNQGPINNVLINSLTQPNYAPVDQHLFSVSVIDPHWQQESHLIEAVIDQLSVWFDIPASAWRHLRTYCVRQALPDQAVPPLLQGEYKLATHPHVYLCGELVDEASINGSLLSGRRLAEQL